MDKIRPSVVIFLTLTLGLYAKSVYYCINNKMFVEDNNTSMIHSIFVLLGLAYLIIAYIDEHQFNPLQYIWNAVKYIANFIDKIFE